MIQINLLEEDGLSKSPVSLKRPTTDEFPDTTAKDEPVESPQEEVEEATLGEETAAKDSIAEEEQESTGSESGKRPKIPRSGDRKDTTKPRPKYEPKKSPFSRGPSLGVIIFLLLVVVGVTLYFLLRHPKKEMTPVPVSPPERTTAPTQPGDQAKPPVKQPEKPTPKPTPQKETSPAKETTAYVPYAGVERSEQDIIDAIQHGRRKVESTHTILSAISGEGHINFISISDDHLSLNAHVYSAAMAEGLRNAILATSLVDTIALFYKDKDDLNSEDGFDIDIYSEIKHPKMSANKNDLKIATLSQIYAKTKEWIGIPSIQLLAWQPQTAETIDGWTRGPMYVQFAGTKVSIMRVLRTIQKAGYNVGISKIYIYNHTNQPLVPGPYQVKLYLTLFGKTD